MLLKKSTLSPFFVLAICVAIGLVIINGGGAKVEEVKAPVAPPEVSYISQRAWPMFRGGQELLGRASGKLADKLKLVWKFKTSQPIKSSPAIADGKVFIGSDDGNVYAIDLKTGKKVWVFKTGGRVEATPCVVGGYVYVGSSDSFLYAIDVQKGTVRWKYQTGAKILGSANWVVPEDGDTLWILTASYDGKLHCVDSANGTVVWAYSTDNYINGTPAVGAGKAVFGGCDGLIHVVSLADGSEISTIDTATYIAASGALLDSRVYIGNYDSLFVCADIDTGKIAWKYKLDDYPIMSCPAVGKDVLVFGGRDKQLHCVDKKNGKKIWTFSAQGDIDSSPIICDDKIVVASQDGRVYMIKLSDGSEVWTYEIGAPIISSPALAEGMIVIGCDDGYVYAFGEK